MIISATDCRLITMPRFINSQNVAKPEASFGGGDWGAVAPPPKEKEKKKKKKEKKKKEKKREKRENERRELWMTSNYYIWSVVFFQIFQ